MFRQRKHGFVALVMALSILVLLVTTTVLNMVVQTNSRSKITTTAFQKQCLETAVPEVCAGLVMDQIQGEYLPADNVLTGTKLAAVKQGILTKTQKSFAVTSNNSSAESLAAITVTVDVWEIVLSGFTVTPTMQNNPDGTSSVILITVGTEACKVSISRKGA